MILVAQCDESAPKIRKTPGRSPTLYRCQIEQTNLLEHIPHQNLHGCENKRNRSHSRRQRVRNRHSETSANARCDEAPEYGVVEDEHVEQIQQNAQDRHERTNSRQNMPRVIEPMPQKQIPQEHCISPTIIQNPLLQQLKIRSAFTAFATIPANRPRPPFVEAFAMDPRAGPDAETRRDEFVVVGRASPTPANVVWGVVFVVGLGTAVLALLTAGRAGNGTRTETIAATQAVGFGRTDSRGGGEEWILVQWFVGEQKIVIVGGIGEGERERHDGRKFAMLLVEKTTAFDRDDDHRSRCSSWRKPALSTAMTTTARGAPRGEKPVYNSEYNLDLT